MKNIIFTLITVLFWVNNAFAGSTILWYLTINGEKITYSVNVEKNIGTKEMNMYNNGIKIIMENEKYSNLHELEKMINSNFNGDIRDFCIIDVTVDER